MDKQRQINYHNAQIEYHWEQIRKIRYGHLRQEQKIVKRIIKKR